MATHARQHLASTIGANVKAGREAMGMTQRDLANRLDTDSMSISRWETGRHRPSASHEVKLAEALFGGDLSALYMERAA